MKYDYSEIYQNRQDPFGSQCKSHPSDDQISGLRLPLALQERTPSGGGGSAGPGNLHSADGLDNVLKPVVSRSRGKVSRIYFRVVSRNPYVYA